MTIPNNFLTLLYALLYIVTSCGLISFNKYLMHEDRFPYAIVLCSLHMITCFTLSLLLYIICPRLYPALAGDRSVVREKMKRGLWVLLPMSFFFAGTLVLSNQAYLYCSLAFLQMMKEGNLILIYVASLICGLEEWNWTLVKVIIFVFLATTGTVVGELRFVWIGFIIQLCSGLCEVAKITLQTVFLTADGLKFDSLSFVLLMSPLCSLVLLAKSLAFQFHPEVWTALVAHWPLLVGNVLTAFALNLSIALFLKASSPTSFIMTGVFKDMCIVICSCLMFRDPVSHMQLGAFCLQLLGIFTYGIVRTFPHDFKDRGVFQGLYSVYLTAKIGDYDELSEREKLLRDVEQQIGGSTAAVGSSSHGADARRSGRKTNGDDDDTDVPSPKEPNMTPTEPSEIEDTPSECSSSKVEGYGTQLVIGPHK